MSRLASVSDYEREIRTVEAMIAEEEALARAHGPSVSSQVVLNSLHARRAELLREMHEFGDEGLPGQEISITVAGAPVRGDRIEADFLGTVLHDVQRLIRSLVAGQYGVTRREGRWEPEIRRRSTLRFAETFTGSFGMTLEAVDEQLELEGHLAVQPAFEELFEVLTSNLDGGDFLQSLAPLTPRSRSHLRHFLEHVRKAEADVSFSWPLVDGRKDAQVSALKAASLSEVLRRLDESQEHETVTGLLEGAILRTGYFEIQTDAGQVIDGRVAPQLQRQITAFFGQRVTATLIVTTVHDRGTDERKTNYRLVELDTAEE